MSINHSDKGNSFLCGIGVLGTMERKFRLSFRHIPSKVSAQVIPSRWQDRAEAAALLSSPPPA
jgi:hypothetical protein